MPAPRRFNKPGPSFNKIRALVLKRDSSTCRRCGEPATEVHHVIADVDDLENIISLCASCHRIMQRQRDKPRETPKAEDTATQGNRRQDG